MKFRVESSYFSNKSEEWKKVVCSVCTYEDEGYYLEAQTLEELKDKLDKLSEEYESLVQLKGCFSLDSTVVINFEDMELTLYDYYLE